jgi:hypothetical protein
MTQLERVRHAIARNERCSRCPKIHRRPLGADCLPARGNGFVVPSELGQRLTLPPRRERAMRGFCRGLFEELRCVGEIASEKKGFAPIEELASMRMLTP